MWWVRRSSPRKLLHSPARLGVERFGAFMCGTCDSEQFLSRINDLLDSSKLWSGQRDFLESVADFIEHNDHVTKAQRAAVEKIAEKHDL